MKITEEQFQNSLYSCFILQLEEKDFDHPVRRAWKGHDFDTLNELEEKGLITQSKTAKSLYFTEEGIAMAKELEEVLAKVVK